MKFNFNWKTILATVLMVVGVAVALTTDVGIVTIGSIVTIVIGASIGISEALKKTLFLYQVFFIIKYDNFT